MERSKKKIKKEGGDMMIKCPECKFDLVTIDCTWSGEKEYIYLSFSCPKCDTYYDSKFKINELVLEEITD